MVKISVMLVAKPKNPLIWADVENGARMLTTENQLKAARALAGMDQAELARRAGLSVTMISNMEGQGDALFRSSFETVQAVQRALEAAGIEFLDGDRPGVRIRASRA